jgi:tellurite methyltransferase
MDKDYWNNYYDKFGEDKEIIHSSSFAQFILNNYLLKKKYNIIELGSGNGRDAVFFAHHSHNVIAIDQSKTAMDVAKKKIDPMVAKYFNPKALDFVLEDYSKYKQVDMFYSRFTIHSITKSNELVLLPKVYNSLKENGLFCIEVRTTKDPLCGIGEACGENTYINDNHKRRFINTDEFRMQVSKLGFKEIYFVEQNNLSVVKNDNPTLMRIVLQK